MIRIPRFLHTLLALGAFAAAAIASGQARQPGAVALQKVDTHWDWCGWGGGGWFWACAYRPTKPGVIYMAGDCLGFYKTEDDGQHWKIKNNGISSYGIYAMAVDPKTPDTVYALTTVSLCKSADAGEHWQSLPDTTKDKLDILGLHNVSIQPLAVDPTDSNIVYAVSGLGKIHKSLDGAQTWKEVFTLPPLEADTPADVLRVEFNAGAPFGAFFVPVVAPSNASADKVQGVGFSFKGYGDAPKGAYISVWGANGAVYRSKDIHDIFEKTDWQDVVLSAADFTVDPTYARNKPREAASWPKQPEWKEVHRLDFTSSSMTKPAICLLKSIYFALPDGQKAVIKDFAADKTVSGYGGVNVKGPKPGSLSSICISESDPRMLLASSLTHGVFLSSDAGQTWKPLATPKSAWHAIFDHKDPKIMYGAFGLEGVYKSVDGGTTWSAINDGITPQSECVMRDIAISPTNSAELFCIGFGAHDYAGHAFWTDNAGQTWHKPDKFIPNPDANATTGAGGLSQPTNVSYCPSDGKKLFISGNWRAAFSADGGRTLDERDRGADISCVEDIRFHKDHVYVGCMDEGLFTSDNNGQHWQSPCPNGNAKISGHYWRLFISDNNGVDRIVSTCSPWSLAMPNCVVISEDGAKTFKVAKDGLLPFRPVANTMWGQSFARAMAADPKDPKTLYLGIDGDPANGQPGGGVFKSTDGGYTWKQLEHQPGSRRMFFGLAVDPTDSKRLYWGACGTGGGLYRSEDGGDSWQLVMKNEPWVFNVAVALDGTVYCPGKDLWRSTDHGNTWTNLTADVPEDHKHQIEALEIDPRDPKTIWFSTTHWSTAWGYIMKTADGGRTWQDITGDIGFRPVTVLRLNPATNELWAGGVGLFKVKQ